MHYRIQRAILPRKMYTRIFLARYSTNETKKALQRAFLEISEKSSKPSIFGSKFLHFASKPFRTILEPPISSRFKLKKIEQPYCAPADFIVHFLKLT